MISPENELHGVEGFLEATRQLVEDDGLVLTRNRVQLIHEGKAIYVTPVHYESLNYLSHIYQPLARGKLVTSEFQDAAKLAARDNADTASDLYPLITVINHTTDMYVTDVVDVAQLIADDELPVYSVPARSKKHGEMITVGMSSYVKGLAGKVGVNPVGVVVIEDGGAHTVEETGLQGWTHLLDAQTRDAEALSMLQKDITRILEGSRHRVTDQSDGRVEIVVRVGTQPDLQTLVLSLIDLVESHHMRLYYTNDEIATGEVGSVFTIVDDSFTPILRLAGERSLDMAAYNAYLAATEIFKELY